MTETIWIVHLGELDQLITEATAHYGYDDHFSFDPITEGPEDARARIQEVLSVDLAEAADNLRLSERFPRLAAAVLALESGATPIDPSWRWGGEYTWTAEEMPLLMAILGPLVRERIRPGEIPDDVVVVIDADPGTNPTLLSAPLGDRPAG